MSFLFDPRHYAHVPVYLWPAVFGQLWTLHHWLQRNPRAVLVTVTADGYVCVDFISDTPDAYADWTRI